MRSGFLCSHTMHFILCFEKMLLIQITKRTDRAGVLRCVRADGSATWQKQDRHAAFFVRHDLTHFAVESVLGARQGFYGVTWTAEEFNQYVTGPARRLTEAELHAIRERRGELFSQWAAVPAGGTLELRFES